MTIEISFNKKNYLFKVKFFKINFSLQYLFINLLRHHSADLLCCIINIHLSNIFHQILV